jgi:FimV-like protein
VLLTFSERVQLKAAKASLASGRAVKGISLGSDGTRLTVELAAKLDKKDELILDGVFDLAASPNAMGPTRVTIIPSPWPTDRSGLVLLWETARAPNIYYDARAKAFRPIDLNELGRARPDRLGAMTFTGGLFAAYGAGDGVVGACKKSNEFAIQATITPAAKQNAGEARILACDRRGGNWRQTNFALHQEGGKLVLYLRTKTEDDAGGLYGTVRRVELCALTAGMANHCVVSYRLGELKCWLNGKPVQLSGEVKGKLSWGRTDRKGGVHFGAVWGADPAALPWRGKLEGVAIFSRAIDASQVARDYAEYAKRLAARKPVVQVTIRGTLAATSRVPNPADIAPYHSALVVHEYDVAKVLSGKYAAKKVRVARWGLIHRKKTAAGRAKVGERRDLVLEKFSDHPELGVELVRNTLADNFDLTLYVEADATVKAPPAAAVATPAKTRLSLARTYLSAGMKTKAQDILREIVKNHPKSKQADEARKLLRKLK